MQVVNMLNAMYTSFDTLIEKHHLYKVVRYIEIFLSHMYPSCEENYHWNQRFATLFISLNLKGYSGFKNPYARLSFFEFNIMFDHKRVHVPNIGSLAHS